jgi:hypothetical protein
MMDLGDIQSRAIQIPHPHDSGFGPEEKHVFENIAAVDDDPKMVFPFFDSWESNEPEEGRPSANMFFPDTQKRVTRISTHLRRIRLSCSLE